MPASLNLIATALRREVVLTGLGFALGFGWLWFDTLQSIWLPVFLWGGVFNGGGTSLFCLLLCAGYALAVWVLARQTGPGLFRATEQRAFTLPRHPARAAHIAALIPICAGAGFSFTHATLYSWLAVSCLALGGCILGIYWLSALLRLEARDSLTSFALAALVSGAAYLVCQPIHLHWLPLLLPVAVFCAWLCGLFVEQEREKRLAAAQKRTRGRPAKTAKAEPDLPKALPMLFVLGMVFFLSGLWQASGTPPYAPAPWMITGILALTACILCFWMQSDENSVSFLGLLRRTIGIALAFLGCLFLFWPMGSVWLIPVLEGVSVAFALLLCMPGNAFFPVCFSGAWCIPVRAALMLGMGIFLGNLGAGGAELLRGMLTQVYPLSPIQAVGGITLLAGIVYSLPGQKKKFREDQTQEQSPQSAEALLAQLSIREKEIAALVLQNMTNKEIGEQLHISEQTVRFHLKNVYQKTGFSRREELRYLEDCLQGAAMEQQKK